MTTRPAATESTPPLPDAHPLRSARWIWPGGQLYLYNTYAQFRHDFDLPRHLRHAPFFITADQSYRLWVNGQFVCRGPARGYQHHWPFDEVDLAPVLRPGHNWISIQAYNPGIGTFQYRHQACAGVICAGRWGSTSVVSDHSWKMRRDPAIRAATARYSLQLAFQEHVESKEDAWQWIADGACDVGSWAGAPEHGVSWDGDVAFGRAPYDTVEARGVPMLEHLLAPPTRALGYAEGACAEGWRCWDNVAWPWVAEANSANWLSTNDIRVILDSGWATLTVPASGVDRWCAVTLDAGEYRVGNVIIRADSRGGEVIDLHFHEGLDGCMPALHRPAEACHVAVANRLRLTAGHNYHDFFHINGFRYVTVVVRNALSPLTVQLTVRHYGYPFTMRGQCVCSDTALNTIVDSCRRSQRICSLDSYMDTPWREQAQWWGDARVQARNTFYMDGDARLLARGIRSIAGQSTATGLTFGHAPTVAYNCILPDFSLTWILTIRDYWWQTGDISLFREQWPRVQQVLAYFDSPEARHASGLLRHDRRYWYFGDWAYLYKGEAPTLLNLWYLLTLRAVVELLGTAHMTGDATAMARRARTHERLVMQHLYDPNRRCFEGGLDAKGRRAMHVDGRGRRVPHYSVHDQTMALTLGLASESHQHLIDAFLLPYLRDEPSEGRGMPSAFWSTYVLELLGQRGYGSEVVAFIRRKWEPMTATGTTWEGFDWHPGSGSSLSHAWSAHPSYHLVNILAGIRQTAPAWKHIEVAPQFVPGIASVSALVPSPQGDIVVGWERSGNDVDVRVACPKQVAATLVVAGKRRRLAGARKPHSVRLSVGP